MAIDLEKFIQLPSKASQSSGLSHIAKAEVSFLKNQPQNTYVFKIGNSGQFTTSLELDNKQEGIIDWKCDCGSTEEVCMHAMAAAIFLRINKAKLAAKSQNNAIDNNNAGMPSKGGNYSMSSISGLTANESELLCAITLWDAPVSQTKCVEICSKLEIKDERDRVFNGPKISECLKELKSKGFLEQTDSGWQPLEDNIRATYEVMAQDSRAMVWVKKIQLILNPYSYWSARPENEPLKKDKRYWKLELLSANKKPLPGMYEEFLDAYIDDHFELIFLDPLNVEALERIHLKDLCFLFYLLVRKDLVSCYEVYDDLHQYIKSKEKNFLEDKEMYNTGICALALLSLWDTDVKNVKRYASYLSDGNLNKFNFMGAAALLEGKEDEAIVYYEASIKLLKKATGKRKVAPMGLSGLFYGLALIKKGDPVSLTLAADAFAIQSDWLSTTGEFLKAAALFLQNKKTEAKLILGTVIADNNFAIIIKSIVEHWVFEDIKKLHSLQLAFNEQQKYGFQWTLMEVASLLALYEKNPSSDFRGIADNVAETNGVKPISTMLKKEASWKMALQGMMALSGKTTTGTAAKQNASRVAYEIDFQSRAIQPLEQKNGKNGWSGGRNIALTRFQEAKLEFMTDQDRAVAKSMKKEAYGYYYGSNPAYYFEWDKTLPVLAGHPNLLLAGAGVRVEIVKEQLPLTLSKKGPQYKLAFSIPLREEGDFILEKETPTRYKLYEVTKQHRAIAAIMDGNLLLVPEEGKEMLMEAIAAMAGSVPLHSELEEHTAATESVTADPRPRLHILPYDEGFKVEIFVKPFGNVPPYAKPGIKPETLFGADGERRLQTRRNLNEELKLVDEMLEATPTLADFPGEGNEWILEDPTDCLSMMVELQEFHKSEKIIIEWPKGEKLKLKGTVGLSQFSVSVGRQNDWFNVNGEIQVSDDQVMGMRAFLQLLDNSKKGFVKLDDGSYMAITEELRKRLAMIQGLADIDKKGDMRFNSLAASALDDLGEGLRSFKADAAWDAHIKRIREAGDIQPSLPKTFEAELRPYQLEGFQWLCRLAHWGVGACLADDMGLGKTIQALALLVHRAKEGPALVMAPVSVTRNWINEGNKFAPTLNMVLFGATDRIESVKNLKSFDVLVISYGLMQQEVELLKETEFATIIVDEAQAIKNRATKRSKAVKELNGRFKIATTGTPIENHLGELHNLFDFLNPGLLGGVEKFNERFVLPIERDKNDDRRKALQRLIKPFVLRRRKNQVLKDLPPKTEINLTVELSEQERSFYEALRLEAMEKMAKLNGVAHEGERKLQVLAEITKLRLACCAPQLVKKDVPFGSSKLELFIETVEELLDNGHKALVFSQFVKYLTLVRALLDKRKIKYQYLDGSTPPKDRQTNIEAFQSGEGGDLFLISLKAGGTGLNLTAADYVIHLDPWWNPAVEDQASDRAHRYGQLRPVTVYRLVTEGTIEEKIVQLHHHKRELSDQLLEGTDSTSRLSADDLLSLLREG